MVVESLPRLRAGTEKKCKPERPVTSNRFHAGWFGALTLSPMTQGREKAQKGWDKEEGLDFHMLYFDSGMGMLEALPVIVTAFVAWACTLLVTGLEKILCPWKREAVQM